MSDIIMQCIDAFAQLLIGAALFGLIAAAIDLLFESV